MLTVQQKMSIKYTMEYLTKIETFAKKYDVLVYYSGTSYQNV